MCFHSTRYATHFFLLRNVAKVSKEGDREQQSGKNERNEKEEAAAERLKKEIPSLIHLVSLFL